MLEYENLIGTPFEVGKHDCFSLGIQFYKQNYDIDIVNYARPKDWDADQYDIINEAFPREGFYKVQDWTLATLQPGDVLAMAVGTARANHFAIYLGENKIIHHVVYKLSNEEPLRDFWRKCICYVLRHKDVTYTPTQKPQSTIEELLRARYNPEPEKAPEES